MIIVYFQRYRGSLWEGREISGLGVWNTVVGLWRELFGKIGRSVAASVRLTKDHGSSTGGFIFQWKGHFVRAVNHCGSSHRPCHPPMAAELSSQGRVGSSHTTSHTSHADTRLPATPTVALCCTDKVQAEQCLRLFWIRGTGRLSRNLIRWICRKWLN